MEAQTGKLFRTVNLIKGNKPLFYRKEYNMSSDIQKDMDSHNEEG